MTTPEMHVMFRQYAQQMGMQNVRAILPEQIDLLLNTAQMDLVNQIIKENVAITNDRIITDNSKIGQINALRNIYLVKEIPLGVEGNPGATSFCFNAEDHYNGKLTSSGGNLNIDYMFLVDFSINYKTAVKGFTGRGPTQDVEYATLTTTPKAFTTNYFPVRLICDSYLADTLNDFILKPRLRSPIIVNYNVDDNGKNIFDLYIDEFITNGSDSTYVLKNNLIPYNLRMTYIAKPKDISYEKDIAGDNRSCQLPEYLHVDLVKRAVDLYHAAVSGSIMSARQQEQTARQENMRNNYRNEGNAQQ